MMLDSSNGPHCWGEEAKPPVFNFLLGTPGGFAV
jgi:hypothetical protein